MRGEVIKRIRGHYEIQEVESGEVYRWRPESVVIECKCGKRWAHKRSTLVASVISCECGADDTTGIREGLVVQQLDEDEAARHPWRHRRSSINTGIPF